MISREELLPFRIFHIQTTKYKQGIFNITSSVANFWFRKWRLSFRVSILGTRNYWCTWFHELLSHTTAEHRHTIWSWYSVWQKKCLVFHLILRCPNWCVPHLDAACLASGLHAGGNIDRVAPDIIMRFPGTNHPSSDGSMVDSWNYTYHYKLFN